MTMLARREHSQLELVNKLLKKGYEADIVDQVAQQLMADSLLSDERFTEMFVRAYTHRGYGPRRIEAELRQRGVSDELVCRYVNSADELWTTSAVAVWAKKFGHKKPANINEKAKQQRFLHYRGFTSEQIKNAINPIDRET